MMSFAVAREASMDESSSEEPVDIEAARSRVGAAEDLVHHQERRIARLRARGLPTEKASALLGSIKKIRNEWRKRLAGLEWPSSDDA